MKPSDANIPFLLLFLLLDYWIHLQYRYAIGILFFQIGIVEVVEMLSATYSAKITTTVEERSSKECKIVVKLFYFSLGLDSINVRSMNWPEIFEALSLVHLLTERMYHSHQNDIQEPNVPWNMNPFERVDASIIYNCMHYVRIRESFKTRTLDRMLYQTNLS